MNQKQIEIIKQQLHVTQGRVTTTSLAVAGAFDKEHYNVLRNIETLDCSPEFRAVNFEGTTYSDAQGKERPAYELTKDGFMFLAMGYTGKVAAQIKEAYIAAFNQLEKMVCANMAEARQDTTDALMLVIAEAAGKGYPGSFIPELIRLRRAGLSTDETGKVLGVCGSTVSTWHRKLEGAGLSLPRAATCPPPSPITSAGSGRPASSPCWGSSNERPGAGVWLGPSRRSAAQRGERGPVPGRGGPLPVSAGRGPRPRGR